MFHISYGNEINDFAGKYKSWNLYTVGSMHGYQENINHFIWPFRCTLHIMKSNKKTMFCGRINNNLVTIDEWCLCKYPFNFFRSFLLYISINKRRFYTFYQQEAFGSCWRLSALIYFVVIFLQILSLPISFNNRSLIVIPGLGRGLL